MTLTTHWTKKKWSSYCLIKQIGLTINRTASVCRKVLSLNSCLLLSSLVLSLGSYSINKKKVYVLLMTAEDYFKHPGCFVSLSLMWEPRVLTFSPSLLEVSTQRELWIVSAVLSYYGSTEKVKLYAWPMIPSLVYRELKSSYRRFHNSLLRERHLVQVLFLHQ